MTPEQPSPLPTCPKCGAPMQRWPRLDGPGWTVVCPACPPPSQAPESPPTPTQAEPAAEAGGTPRFRDLIGTQPAPGSTLPESLLEDLPEQARQLLKGKPAPRPTTGPLREQLTDSLARQGYVLTEDAHGVRITGAPRAGGTGGLSASDVVRMAADLDGGILPTEKRARCPKCDAVVARQATRCEWCGQTLAPPGTDALDPA